MKKLLRLLQHKPSGAAAWAMTIGIIVAWGLIRLVISNEVFFPLTYVLPLLFCIWTRRKALLWTTAGIFVAMAVFELYLILPGQRVLYIMASTMITLLAGAVMAHLVILLLDSLEKALMERDAINDQACGQKEELRRHWDHLDEIVRERTTNCRQETSSAKRRYRIASRRKKKRQISSPRSSRPGKWKPSAGLQRG